MDRILTPATAALAAGAIIAAAALAGCANPARPRDLANPNVPAHVLAEQVCSNCHGLDGNAVSPNFPNLAAQTPEYLVAQLKGFRSHDRQDPAGFEYMWGLSRSLSDAQIDGLAAYYSKQMPRDHAATGTAQEVAAGRAIFESGLPDKGAPPCSTCHGPKGAGNGQFPRIAGQHSDYLMKQLVVFQRTDERPEGSVMKMVAHSLTPDDIRNVAAYVQTLPAQ